MGGGASGSLRSAAAGAGSAEVLAGVAHLLALSAWAALDLSRALESVVSFLSEIFGG